MVTRLGADAIADRPLSAFDSAPITGADVIAYCDRLVQTFEMRSTRGRIGALCDSIIAAECGRDFGDDTRTIRGGLAFRDAVLVLLRDRLDRASNERIARVAGRRA